MVLRRTDLSLIQRQQWRSPWFPCNICAAGKRSLDQEHRWCQRKFSLPNNFQDSFWPHPPIKVNQLINPGPNQRGGNHNLWQQPWCPRLSGEWNGVEEMELSTRIPSGTVDVGMRGNCISRLVSTRGNPWAFLQQQHRIMYERTARRGPKEAGFESLSNHEPWIHLSIREFIPL